MSRRIRYTYAPPETRRACLVSLALSILSLVPVLPATPPGPHTELVDVGRYSTLVYVDQRTGDDAAGDGVSPVVTKSANSTATSQK